MSATVIHEPYRLGNLDFARYIDHALGILRDLAKPVGLALLFLVVPLQAAFFVLDVALGISESINRGPVNSVTGLADPALLGMWGRNFAIFMAHTLVMQAVIMLVAIAVTYMVGMRYLDNPVLLREALRFAIRRYPAVLLAHIVYFTAFAVGMLFCVIPGILVTVYFYLFVPAMVFESAGPIAALQRSRSLVANGEALRIFFLIFVLSFIGLPLFAVTLVVPHAATDFFLQSLVGAVIAMFAATVVTVVYFALRCKHEALDLEIRANAIDAAAVTEAPAL